jgi:hypothetical protein
LIQNCLNHKFLSPQKTWVVDPARAENFEKTLRAWGEIDEQRLTGVRIVLDFEENVPDVPLANVGKDTACGKGLNLRSESSLRANCS